MMDNRSAG